MAFRTPTIGRQLYRLAGEAGFEDIAVQVVARPDTKGHLLHFIRNAAGYARLSGELSDAEIDSVLNQAEESARAGTIFALNAQYMVTARA